MPRTLVVLATAKIEDADHCSWECPLFSRIVGAQCAMVTPSSFTRSGVKSTPLVLDGRTECYLRHSHCKTANVAVSET